MNISIKFSLFIILMVAIMMITGTKATCDEKKCIEICDKCFHCCFSFSNSNCKQDYYC